MINQLIQINWKSCRKQEISAEERQMNRVFTAGKAVLTQAKKTPAAGSQQGFFRSNNQ